MPEVVRYLCIALLDGARRVFFWESDDDSNDRVVVDDAGFVVSFASEDAARAAATGGPVSPDAPSFYDLDAIQVWCRSTATVTDCPGLLNAWNLFGDLPRGDGLFARMDATSSSLYDKLFHGCNLPAITPSGNEYTPLFSESEVATLKRLLLLGLAEFRAGLR